MAKRKRKYTRYTDQQVIEWGEVAGVKGEAAACKKLGMRRKSSHHYRARFQRIQLAQSKTRSRKDMPRDTQVTLVQLARRYERVKRERTRELDAIKTEMIQYT